MLSERKVAVAVNRTQIQQNQRKEIFEDEKIIINNYGGGERVRSSAEWFEKDG